jgi:hypothetical protein
MPPAQGGWQPQPGQMPPGSFIPGDQGPKKRRKWPWILLGIFLLMVLGIGACSVFVFRAISGPTDYANTFADQLYTNPSGAAGELCPGSTIDAAGLQKTHDALIAAGWTGSKALYGAQVNSNNGDTSAGIAGTLGSSSVTFELAKRNGDWCVMNVVDTASVTQFPDISIPDISIPDISIPDFTIPDISVPELEITPAN